MDAGPATALRLEHFEHSMHHKLINWIMKPCGHYTRIGSNKGKTPEHNQAKHTKHPHSLEALWYIYLTREEE